MILKIALDDEALARLMAFLVSPTNKEGPEGYYVVGHSNADVMKYQADDGFAKVIQMKRGALRTSVTIEMAENWCEATEHPKDDKKNLPRHRITALLDALGLYPTATVEETEQK
jgi:hypothetical protein